MRVLVSERIVGLLFWLCVSRIAVILHLSLSKYLGICDDLLQEFSISHDCLVHFKQLVFVPQSS